MPPNYSLEHHRSNLVSLIISLFVFVPMITAFSVILLIVGSTRSHCMNFAAWAWLLVHDVTYVLEVAIVVVSNIRNVRYLLRHGHARDHQDHWIVRRSFNVIWLMLGFVLTDRVDVVCRHEVRSVILASSIINFLLILAIAIMMGWCSRCTNEFAVSLVQPLGAVLVVEEYQQVEDKAERELCAICLGDLEPGEQVKRVSVCMHRYHGACVEAWIRVHNTCPLCRERVYPS